jgi:phasin family protein
MSVPTPEQFIDAHKANVEALFGLANKTFEGVEKLVKLNLQSAKATLEEGQESAQRALSVKDAEEAFALQSEVAQPLAEKVLSYGRHVFEILAATQAEFARVAEAQFEEQNRKFHATVENFAKNAPAGSETAVAVIKSAVSAADSAYDTVRKAAKQAADLAESNFNAATTAATKAVEQAASQASRTTKKAATA